MNQEIKNEVKLIRRAEGFYVLNRNGLDMLCPFVPPVPMVAQNANIIGGKSQIVNSRASCNSMCPLMQIADKNIHLGCGGAATYTNVEVLDEAIVPENPKKESGSSGKIITMKGDGAVN